MAVEEQDGKREEGGHDMKSTIFALLMVASSSSAQTIEEVRAELHKQRVPHPHIVLAQARLETGNFKSRRCREHHNLFGMKSRNRYVRYKNWRDSVRDYKERISSRYNGGDYYAFLLRIKYAEDKAYIKKLKQF